MIFSPSQMQKERTISPIETLLKVIFLVPYYCHISPVPGGGVSSHVTDINENYFF